MKEYLLVICFFIGVAPSVCGQSDAPDWRRAFWIDVGVGPGNRGLVISTDLNFEVKQNWAIAIRVDGVDETEDSDGASCPDKINSQGVSLMFGRIIRMNRLLMLINAGPSGVDQHYNPCTAVMTDQHHEPSLGVDISVKAIVTTKYFGAGINPFININDKRSYYGLTVNLAVGRFR